VDQKCLFSKKEPHEWILSWPITCIINHVITPFMKTTEMGSMFLSSLLSLKINSAITWVVGFFHFIVKLFNFCFFCFFHWHQTLSHQCSSWYRVWPHRTMYSHDLMVSCMILWIRHSLYQGSVNIREVVVKKQTPSEGGIVCIIIIHDI